ncbi:MAG TPA: spore germination protein [Methylomusa anaerophila]|uniref:Spore germination protein B1 n=1 Tax=Methylomusa anaerophila TaxID=1930071 RepID=A0A348AMQ0_9FIRM|nr:spore germination protein [Methylomusa anaerophila]BBB92348.1 spore germination protein B1 [Methylomusa anaerophila]HML90013.1 spore germination protein [Methylomusa anaerophila]
MKNEHNEYMDMKINKDIDANINYLKELVGVGESFDIIFREYKVGRRRAASFSINGMTNDVLLTNVFQNMILFNQDDLSINTLQKLFYSHATHSQVKLVDNMHDAVISMLSGELIFFVDNEEQVIVFDARAYPVRAPEESNIEKVTRGSRDSFVETLPFSTSLIRRRLRDPNLRFEIVKVGTRSQTDVAVAYIKDIVNPDLIKIIKERLNSIVIDGVPMAEKAIEEFVLRGSKWNPLPKVRYTERPDVVAVHLLEGHVCLIVDTTPDAMILPTTFWHHVQHVEEYHQNPLIGSYLRLVRLFGILMSLLLPPVWLAMSLQQHLLPESLAFLGPRDPGIIPLGVQFILADIGVELVRMATVHVPSAQSTALGFIGAFMLGEFATKVGLFGNEVIFYTAVAAVGGFATPSVELSMTMRFFRIGLLLLVMFFKLPGLFIGIIAIFLIMLGTKSLNFPYLWPLFPFNYQAMKDVIFRLPIPKKVLRPAMLKPQDKDRQEK